MSYSSGNSYTLSPYNVVAIVGQSNAEGGASITELSPVQLESARRVPYFYLISSGTSGAWIPTQPKGNTHGAEITLAQGLQRRWAILKCAFDGSPVASRWQPGDDHYSTLISTLQTWLPRLPGGGVLRTIFHIAGEGDAANSDWASAYRTNCLNLYRGVQSALGLSSLSIVLNRLSILSDRPFKSVVRENQMVLGNPVANNAQWFSIDDGLLLDQGSPGPDGDIHFASITQQYAGQRAAGIMLGKFPAKYYQSPEAP